MSTQWKTMVAAPLLAFVVSLAGCGGGGSGDSGGTVSVPTDPVSITPANAVQVASATLGAVDVLSDFDADVLIGIASGPAGSAGAANERLELADILSAQLSRLRVLVPQTGSMVTIAVAIPPETFPCLVSGTLTVSGEIADPTFSTLTAGDVITGSFSSCDDGDGYVISGTLTITIQAFTGDLFVPPYSLTASFALSNLSLTQAGETLTLNGTATLTESTQNDFFFTSTLSGASLSFTESTGDAGTLTNFISDGTDDFNTLEYTVDSSGTLATLDLTGSVQYATTATFRGIGDNYPFEGVLVVTGANNSTETVTALVDSINITIDVDENGDGIIDQTINTTWDAL